MAELLLTQRDRDRAGELLGSYGLENDGRYDVMMGITDLTGRLIATGARDGYTLKMIAVAPDCQASEVYSDLVTSLVTNGYEAGYESFLVFTKPEFYHAFTALNFHLLSVTAKVALLEYGRGIRNYLDSGSGLVKSGENGAVIMNCNPFTKGHRYLAEKAAQECDNLYIFVVEEDSSSFPFHVRYRLVQEGTADISNASVLPTGPYAVSRVTFPSYFIDSGTDVSRHQLETDLNIFTKHIAPYFNIKKRFAGTEPYCGITNAYNEGMKEILPSHGIEFIEIDRLENEEGAVSASRVRRLLTENKKEEAAGLVPETTASYFFSDRFESEVNTAQMTGRH